MEQKIISMMDKPKDKRTKEYKKWLKEYKQWLKDNQQGLGDKVDYMLNETPLKNVTKIIKKVMFKDGEDCGCDKRRQRLNEIMPYRNKPARCLTETEYYEYRNFAETRTMRLDAAQVDFVCSLYASVFNKPKFKPCLTCSPKPLMKMIELLDKVFDSYGDK